MSDTILVAAITASSSVLISVVALLLNYQGFHSLVRGMASLERRIEVIEKDLKDFFKTVAEQDKRIARLEDRP